VFCSLEKNKIGLKGGAAIGKGLKQNKSLTFLNLAWNDIGDKGAVAIGNAIAENSNCALVTLM